MPDHVIIDYGDARRWGKMGSYDPTEPSKEATSPAELYHHSIEGSSATTPLHQEPLPGQAYVVSVGVSVGVGVAVAFVLCILLTVGLVCLGSKIHSYIMRRNFVSQLDQLRPVQPVRPLMQNQQDMERCPAADKKESMI